MILIDKITNYFLGTAFLVISSSNFPNRFEVLELIEGDYKIGRKNLEGKMYQFEAEEKEIWFSKNFSASHTVVVGQLKINSDNTAISSGWKISGASEEIQISKNKEVMGLLEPDGPDERQIILNGFEHVKLLEAPEIVIWYIPKCNQLLESLSNSETSKQILSDLCRYKLWMPAAMLLQGNGKNEEAIEFWEKEILAVKNGTRSNNSIDPQLTLDLINYQIQKLEKILNPDKKLTTDYQRIILDSFGIPYFEIKVGGTKFKQENGTSLEFYIINHSNIAMLKISIMFSCKGLGIEHQFEVDKLAGLDIKVEKLLINDVSVSGIHETIIKTSFTNEATGERFENSINEGSLDVKIKRKIVRAKHISHLVANEDTGITAYSIGHFVADEDTDVIADYIGKVTKVPRGKN